MATPFPRLTPPQFASPAKPAVLLIRAVKSSYTTGTLYDMVAKVYIFYNNYIDEMNYL
jgi:hypothetical protein